jgi:hypothetical protein
MNAPHIALFGHTMGSDVPHRMTVSVCSGLTYTIWVVGVETLSIMFYRREENSWSCLFVSQSYGVGLTAISGPESTCI